MLKVLSSVFSARADTKMTPCKVIKYGSKGSLSKYKGPSSAIIEIRNPMIPTLASVKRYWL